MSAASWERFTCKIVRTEVSSWCPATAAQRLGDNDVWGVRWDGISTWPPFHLAFVSLVHICHGQGEQDEDPQYAANDN